MTLPFQSAVENLPPSTVVPSSVSGLPLRLRSLPAAAIPVAISCAAGLLRSLSTIFSARSRSSSLAAASSVNMATTGTSCSSLLFDLASFSSSSTIFPCSAASLLFCQKRTNSSVAFHCADSRPLARFSSVLTASASPSTASIASNCRCATIACPRAACSTEPSSSNSATSFFIGGITLGAISWRFCGSSSSSAEFSTSLTSLPVV